MTDVQYTPASHDDKIRGLFSHINCFPLGNKGRGGLAQIKNRRQV